MRTNRNFIGLAYRREYKFKYTGGVWLLDVVKEQYLPDDGEMPHWKIPLYNHLKIHNVLIIK